MTFLNYNKNEKLEFNYKRACGLWLIVVAVVIAIATLVGGKQIINMQVFSIGYVISFFSINMNKKVLNKLSDGPSSEFQNKISSYAVILLFVLMVLLGGPFFATEKLETDLARGTDGNRPAFLPLLFCAWKFNDIPGPYLCH